METDNYNMEILLEFELSAEIYINILSFRFNPEFWKMERSLQDQLLQKNNELFDSYRERLINLRTYRSIRHDSDLLIWASSENPEELISLKESINREMSGKAEANHGMFSLYEHSPYLRADQPLSESLKFPPLKYFVAYPMNKSPEWYLVDSGQRKAIMSEHIRMATSDPDNKDIRSYTTYSYGISDQEFVVMYETDSLSRWSHVTARLREAKQREWVTKEYPIFVGILSEPYRF